MPMLLFNYTVLLVSVRTRNPMNNAIYSKVISKSTEFTPLPPKSDCRYLILNPNCNSTWALKFWKVLKTNMFNRESHTIANTNLLITIIWCVFNHIICTCSHMVWGTRVWITISITNVFWCSHQNLHVRLVATLNLRLRWKLGVKLGVRGPWKLGSYL